MSKKGFGEGKSKWDGHFSSLKNFLFLILKWSEEKNFLVQNELERETSVLAKMIFSSSCFWETFLFFNFRHKESASEGKNYQKIFLRDLKLGKKIMIRKFFKKNQKTKNNFISKSIIIRNFVINRGWDVRLSK